MKELKSLRAFQKIRREKEEKNTPSAKRRGLPQKIIRFAALAIFIMVVGGTGGIIIDRFGLPYLLVQFPELNRYEFLKRVNERTVIVEKTVETKISSDRAEIEAIKKASFSLTAIAFFDKEINNDKDIDFPNNGADKKIGFIFTSDGLIVAKTDHSPQKNEIIKIKFQDGKILGAKWVGFDKSNGIAVLKVESDNLPMATFANSDNLELGEKLIAVSKEMIMDISVSRIVNDYFPAINSENENSAAAQKRVIITKNLSPNFRGVPLINIKGEIIGISEKENLVVPINEIRNSIDKMLEK